MGINLKQVETHGCASYFQKMRLNFKFSKIKKPLKVLLKEACCVARLFKSLFSF